MIPSSRDPIEIGLSVEPDVVDADLIDHVDSVDRGDDYDPVGDSGDPIRADMIDSRRALKEDPHPDPPIDLLR